MTFSKLVSSVMTLSAASFLFAGSAMADGLPVRIEKAYSDTFKSRDSAPAERASFLDKHLCLQQMVSELETQQPPFAVVCPKGETPAYAMPLTRTSERHVSKVTNETSYTYTTSLGLSIGCLNKAGQYKSQVGISKEVKNEGEFTDVDEDCHAGFLTSMLAQEKHSQDLAREAASAKNRTIANDAEVKDTARPTAKKSKDLPAEAKAQSAGEYVAPESGLTAKPVK